MDKDAQTVANFLKFYTTLNSIVGGSLGSHTGGKNYKLILIMQ